MEMVQLLRNQLLWFQKSCRFGWDCAVRQLGVVYCTMPS